LSNPSDDATAVAEAVLNAQAQAALLTLTDGLRQFICSDFAIGSCVSVIDASGTSSPPYSIVIYRAADQPAAAQNCARAIPADRAAVVIEVCDELDANGFRDAYSRISKVKRLVKSPIPKSEDGARTNITLGIVFARTSTCSLDALADELYRLNSEAHHRLWLWAHRLAEHFQHNTERRAAVQLRTGVGRSRCLLSVVR
jgi:hypothetical protein